MNKEDSKLVVKSDEDLAKEIRKKFSVRRKGTNSKPYIFTNLKGEKVYIIK